MQTAREPPPSTPSVSCLVRVRTDLISLYKDPLPGITVSVDEKDIRNIHALVAGPSETPYEGGFFLFKIHIPEEFPVGPPHVTVSQSSTEDKILEPPARNQNSEHARYLRMFARPMI